MKFDWDAIRDLEARKLVSVRNHHMFPDDLFIVNYTDHAQHAWMWDEVPLLKDCRGLILNREGEVIAKGFKKFFNIGEEHKMETLTTLGPPEITEKLDGSLAILYRYKNNPYMFSTRGSFVSDQAISANMLWVRRYIDREPDLGPFTYLFEFVGPTNRIVVAYPHEELYLIGMVDPATGYELPWHRVESEGKRLGFPMAKTYTDSWQDLSKTPVTNFEGYVLSWPAQGIRVKIKLEEYLKLHRIVSSLSEKTVWESMRDRTNRELREQLPEEHYEWFDKVSGKFLYEYGQNLVLINEALARVKDLNPKIREERAQIARTFLSEPALLRPVLFRAIDEQDWRTDLWNVVKPV